MEEQKKKKPVGLVELTDPNFPDPMQAFVDAGLIEDLGDGSFRTTLLGRCFLSFFRSQETDQLDVHWKSAEHLGMCDAIGGMEYERVKAEWKAAGKPSDVHRFIVARANAFD